MVEWVEALRAKLREMKILSPRENVYTKLPEIRAPLLPTRDPNSPLPAPPPVPAAIVPGIERIPQNAVSVSATTTVVPPPTEQTIQTISEQQSPSASSMATQTQPNATNITTSSQLAVTMSNTLSQNLLNMLSDPMSAYNEQLTEDTSENDFDNFMCSEDDENTFTLCDDKTNSNVPELNSKAVRPTLSNCSTDSDVLTHSRFIHRESGK